jgi:hypothetical protein
VYGSLLFLGREGEPSYDQNDPDKSIGINVGDIWTFRSYIEGGTKAAAIWTFKDLDVDRLRELDELRLEHRFEAFRSHKGTINEPVRYKLTLVNESKNLRVSNGELERGVAEFSEEFQRQSEGALTSDKTATTVQERPTAVINIPRTISYVDTSAGDAQAKTADLFDDLFDGNSLTVEVMCLDPQQYLGAAPSDLFIRLPDRSFASTYFKSIFGMWLMLMLICLLGTTASCFVKGPVATLLTFSLLLLGRHLRPQMDDLLTQFQTNRGEVLGGGMLESMYRIVTQMNQSQALPDNAGIAMMKWIDQRVFDLLGVLRNIIPNFSYFDTSAYSANGFDVSWNVALLPSVAIALAYIIPCILLGYFSLQLRELEAK